MIEIRNEINKYFRNKKHWIKPFIRGKRVLDLGCVQHTTEKEKEEDWLHSFICKHAESVLGVDYLDEEVKKLKKRGYDVISANVESMELGEEFEVIVAGDIIEHLSNLGKFMECLNKHLSPNGIILITTPNPVCIIRYVQVMFYKEVGAHSEHTCWFTEHVLQQLANRYGLEIFEVAYVNVSHKKYPNLEWWIWKFLNDFICLVIPQFSETLCFALRKRKEG